MSMDYIRKTYGVPARRGGKVRFRPTDGGVPCLGVIVGSRSAHLRVKFDGMRHSMSVHPTWQLEYLP